VTKYALMFSGITNEETPYETVDLHGKLCTL